MKFKHLYGHNLLQVQIKYFWEFKPVHWTAQLIDDIQSHLELCLPLAEASHDSFDAVEDPIFLFSIGSSVICDSSTGGPDLLTEGLLTFEGADVAPDCWTPSLII